MGTVVSLRQAEDIRSVVAGEVRAWMGRRNVNQTMLAEAIGLSQSQVSKRLKGTIPFDIDDLAKTARFLGVEVAELVGGVPAATPPNGGIPVQRARRDSNPQPSDPKVRVFAPQAA